MANTRDIKRRIKSVTNIQQITNAMKMVAAARLRRAEEKALSTRPYAKKLEEMLFHITTSTPGLENPLLEHRAVRKTGYLIIGADKGLAGAYNSNLMKEMLQQIADKDEETYTLITVGKKPWEYLFNRDYEIEDHYGGFSERPTFQHARELAKVVSERFTEEKVDEVIVIYTHFYSALSHKPVVQKILPIETGEPEPVEQEEEEKDDFFSVDDFDTIEDLEELEEEGYIFLPDVVTVFESLLPQYLEISIYNALLQSAASELGSRMTAMTSATDNAGELIDDLTLSYNKARQAAITNEISEIVSGANALE